MRLYRPPDAKWDDDRSTKTRYVELINVEYDLAARRKCFDCMANLAVRGSFRCVACKYKRDRRVSGAQAS